MKHLIILICSVLGVLTASAQRPWSIGALTVDEFRGTPALDGSQSYMAQEIQLSTVPVPGSQEVFTQEAEAVMFPDRSYLAPDQRNERGLRYFQARFDLMEVFSRRLRKELASGVSGIEADRRLAYYTGLYKDEAERMDRATTYGQNEEALQNWEYDIRRALEEIPRAEAAQVVPSPWSYGLFVGVGGMFPTSTVSKAFSGGCVFTFGIMGGWKRLRLHGSIGYTTPTVRNRALVTPDYAGQGYLANVKNANLLDLGFGLGYAVLDTKHFSIEPYVGGHWTGYNWTARQMTPNDDGSYTATGLQHKMEMDDFNFSCGINFEWHFHSVVTTFPIFGDKREQYISSLRVTPYLTRGVYTDCTSRYRGWQVGFMISYSGVARALSLR